MNTFRILINLGISAACSIGGVYLLFQDSIFVRDRNDPTVGLQFSGASLYSLSLALFCIAAFSIAVSRAWSKGDLSMPGADEIRPHPAYKGQLLVKYWYFTAPAIGFVVVAFLLASHVRAPL